MSLERIRAQLEKFGLAKPDDEMSVTMMPVGPFLLFGDSTGDNLLIAREDVSIKFLSICRPFPVRNFGVDGGLIPSCAIEDLRRFGPVSRRTLLTSR